MDGKSGVSPELVPALPRTDGDGVKKSDAIFSANIGDGSFTYRMPLQCPPGRAGSEPNLELTYRLRTHGNGVFGTGWDVDVPSIRRRTDRGFPRFDDSDEFVTNSGERLIRLSPGEFRPLVEESFRRIQFDGSQWEITERNGTRTVLGASPESRVFDPADPTHVFEWRAGRVEDLNGNVTRFRYRRDVEVKYPEGYAAAQLYLRRIEYTNLDANDFLNSIVFFYAEGRSDAWTDFRAGFPIRTTRHCTEITSFASDLSADASRVVDFGAEPFSAHGSSDWRETRAARYGVLVSRPRSGQIHVEFPVPLTGVRLQLDTSAGSSYVVRELNASGVVVETSVAGTGGALDVILGAAVIAADIDSHGVANLALREVEMARERLPVVHSRYRFDYSPTIVDLESPDIENVPPATLHLRRVRRVGYDSAFTERGLPTMEFQYRQLDLTRLTPLIVSGSPREPLGNANTTLLSFAGTGRPDLLQTQPFHRVFFNRGSTHPQVALNAVQMQESPSVTLEQMDVFLRDVRGLGAVDLTTPEYFYPNPSADGAVSRTAPSWGMRRPFDGAERHPEFSPEQLVLTRSVDVDGDGVPDLLCTDESFLSWRNLGNGRWSAAIVTERIASFGESRFPDISFDDAQVFVADMNGDGLDEIVRVSSRKVEYWTAVNGQWRYIKTTMMRAPRIRDFDPQRVVLADVTGNGAADLAYVHGNSVELFLNVGGTSFARGLQVDFTDFGINRGLPMPNNATFATGVDFLGDGSAGLLWSVERQDVEPNYFYLPLSRLGKPFVLTRIDNGRGGVTLLDYSTSSTLAAADDISGNAWTYEPPYPVVVLTSITQTDLVNSASSQTQYRYRNGWYDRLERHFRGFEEVEERRLEVPGVIEGLVVRHRFESGVPASGNPVDIATARALAGRKTQTSYHRMSDGRLLREEHAINRADSVYRWESTDPSRAPVSPLRGSAEDEFILAPYLSQEIRVDMEGSLASRYAAVEYRRRVNTGDGEVLDEYGRLRSEIHYGEVLPGPAGPAAIAAIPSGDQTIWLYHAGDVASYRTDYDYALNAAAHICNLPSRIATFAGAAMDTLVGEDRLYYDGGAAVDDFLPLGQVNQGNPQRREKLFAKEALLSSIFPANILNAIGADENSGPGYFLRSDCVDGQPGLFAITERNIYAQVDGRIRYGVRTRSVDARGFGSTRTFDAALWYVQRVTNALGHTRVTERTDYRTGQPLRVLDENGVRSSAIYDAFGRVTSIRKDSDTFATAQIESEYFDDSFALTGGPTSVRTRKLIDHLEVPGRYVTTISYLDGIGREVMSGMSSDSSGDDYVMVGYGFDAFGGNPSWVSVPFWAADPDSADPSFEPRRVFVRDPLSRQTRIVEPDGAERTVSFPSPWTAILADPEDLNPASRHYDTPLDVSYDAFGRTVQVRQLVRDSTGPGSEMTVSARFTYDAYGHLASVTRPDTQSVTFDYSNSGILLRTTHPDSRITIRLADAAGNEIYSRNAAGDHRWTFYDELGRITREVAGSDPSAAAAVTYTYDNVAVNGVGRLTKVTNTEEAHEVDYEFDRLGNTSSTKYALAGGDLGADVCSYNALGLPSVRTYNDSSTITYEYGRDGKASRAEFQSGPTGVTAVLFEDVLYDVSGAISAAKVSDGAVEFNASYDPLTQRLLQRTYRRDDGTTLLDLTVDAYDSIGNIRGFTEHVDQSGEVSWTLQYDSLYRLGAASASQAGATVAAFEYHNDNAGNNIRNDEAAPGAALVYDAANMPDALRGTTVAPATFSYDAAGRTTACPPLAEIVWTNTGRPRRFRNAAGDRCSFVYTHKGRLLRLTNVPMGGAGNTITFVSGDREIHAGGNHYFGLLGEERFVSVAANGDVTLQLRSLGGSIVASTDAAGVVDAASIERFAPFGSTIGPAPTNPPLRGFAGAVRTLPGVYFQGARALMSSWGRFLCTDPLSAFAPKESTILDVRQLNPYSYAFWNPILYVDKSGLQATQDQTVTPGAAGQSGLDTESLTLNVVQRGFDIFELVVTGAPKSPGEVLVVGVGFMIGGVGFIDASNDPTAQTIGGVLDIAGAVVSIGSFVIFGGGYLAIGSIGIGTYKATDFLIEGTALESAFGEAAYEVLDYHFPEPDPPGYRKVIADEQREWVSQHSTIYVSPGSQWDNFLKANKSGWVSGQPNRLGD